MYLPGTIVVTQGMMAERKGLLCEYPGGGLLLCGVKERDEDHIH